MDKLFKIPLLEDFKQITEEIIANLYNAEKQHFNILSDSDVKQIKAEVSKYLLKNNYELDALATLLESKQYNENKLSYFISCIKERKNELLLSMLINFNTAHGETVIDFDWFFKLILGTSEMKHIKYPLLQLLLLTVTKTGEKCHQVYDVNKNMLDKIINTLEDSLTL